MQNSLIENINKNIEQEKWQELIEYLNKVIQKQSSDGQQKQGKIWAVDYTEQKKQTHGEILQKYSQFVEKISNNQSKSDSLLLLQQSLLKLFSKGLIIPQLTYSQDIQILSKIIQNSCNKKYLIYIFHQTLYEIRDIYENRYLDNFDRIYLKVVSVSRSFLKVVGLPVFSDVAELYKTFYQVFNKILNQERCINQSNTQLQNFLSCFFDNTILNLKNIFTENTQQNQKIINSLQQKRQQSSKLFTLLSLIYKQHLQNSQQLQQVVSITDLIVQKIQIPGLQLEQIPSFWVIKNISKFNDIYDQKYLLYYWGNILIKQLPQKPQYFKIPTHLYSLLKECCKIILLFKQSLNSLGLKDKQTFFIDLFERFSILIGFLNKQKEEQKQIESMINFILNKKALFSDPKLHQILWRTIIQRHQSLNFQNFCIGQYKRVFCLPIKQLTKSVTQILLQSSQLVIKLINQLQGNSNAQKIGFIITLTIYFLSCLKKMSKYYMSLNQNNQSEKQKKVFNLFLNQEKITSLKQEIMKKYQKLKQSLKDRLQVNKMNDKKIVNQQKVKELNQLSVCVYRIQEQLKFD